MERLELFLRACSHQCPKISTSKYLCMRLIYLFMCVYIYIYICLHICIYVCKEMSIHEYTCLCVHEYTYMHIHRHVYTYLYMLYTCLHHICLYMPIYIYMYQCTHVRYMCVYVRVVLNSFTRKKTSALNKNFTFAKLSPYPCLTLAVHQASMEQDLGQMSHCNFSVVAAQCCTFRFDAFCIVFWSLLTFIGQF